MRSTAPVLVLCLVSPFVAAGPKVHRGLAYAEPKHERQTLDVYAPTKGKNLPVVVWIHGGGWQRGDKKEVHQKPQAFADKGFVFVAINYRLLPKATIKQMAEDVAKAIRWVHDHARDYGGDPNTMIVMGHSAGAQLAALVCTDDRYLKAEGPPLSIVKGCVPVDGDIYDVAMPNAAVEAKRAARYRIKFGDEKMQQELSAVTHVAKGKHIPPYRHGNFSRCGAGIRFEESGPHTPPPVSILYLSLDVTPLTSDSDAWLDFVMESRRLAGGQRYRERLRQLNMRFSRAA